MSINQLIKNIRKLECSYNNPVTFHFENTVSAEKISIKMCKASALHSKNCFSNSCWCTATVRAFSYSIKKCKASALHSKNCFSNSCWCTATVRAFSYSIKKCKASALHSKNCFSNSCWCTATARAVSYSIKKAATQSCVTAFLLYYDYSFFKHLKNSRQALVKPAILLQDVYYVYSDFLNNHMHADRNK